MPMSTPAIAKRLARGLSLAAASAAVLASGVPMASAVLAAPAYQSGAIGNDMARCKSGGGPAILATISGIKSGSGKIRVQTYRATQSEWLASGKWLNRIEIPAKAGTMTVCLPLPANGTYGVAVRHDINANGKTDITQDGGGMSNNPAINILNLGKPKYTKVGVGVRDEVKAIRIDMKYM